MLRHKCTGFVNAKNEIHIARKSARNQIVYIGNVRFVLKSLQKKFTAVISQRHSGFVTIEKVAAIP
jgi:hypothetical protein